MIEKETILTTYRKNPKNKTKLKNIKKTKKPRFLMSKEEIMKRIKRKRRTIKILKVLIIVSVLIILAQYVYMKYQISNYDIDDGYTCVHMSYDKEKFFEGLGFHVVQRRVEGVHRWIAIEIWDGVYIDYESTLNFFGLHLVNEEMAGKYIYQSEGFFDGNKEIVKVDTVWDMHTKLKDWEVVATEGLSTNMDFFKNLP